MSRVSVAKTYKLFIGGKFVRSESGRSYPATTGKGDFVANTAKASRKDARDAVRAARAAVTPWSGATAYNRGQVLYRVAEMLEHRREQFISEIASAGSISRNAATTEIDAAIDLWVWYAGWADKYVQVAGNANPVAGPYFNLSVPEPVGVVAAVAPQPAKQSFLGLISVIAPAIVSGNAIIVIGAQNAPLTALTLAEVLATSDIPAGVVNILTGDPAEIVPWLASHADVNALDLTGAGVLPWAEYEKTAADTVKRIVRPRSVIGQSLAQILAFTEMKTVWHTKSLK